MITQAARASIHARISRTFGLVLVAAGMSVPSLGAAQHDADARLQAIYTAEWKWREQQLADGEDSQRPIEDHLPKADPGAQEMRLHYWEDVHHKLDAIDRAQLSPKEQINYDVYRPQIEVLMETSASALMRCRPTRTRPFGPIWGIRRAATSAREKSTRTGLASCT